VAVVGVHLEEDAQGELGLVGVAARDEGVHLLYALLHRLLALVDGFEALHFGKHRRRPRTGGGLPGQLLRRFARREPVAGVQAVAVALLERRRQALLLGRGTRLLQPLAIRV
jgi:hypothetical protein